MPAAAKKVPRYLTFGIGVAIRIMKPMILQEVIIGHGEANEKC